VAVVTVKALACELPAETGVPLSRWSALDLAVEAVARGVVESISASTVPSNDRLLGNDRSDRQARLPVLRKRRDKPVWRRRWRSSTPKG
jgi:hypothetical protein